MVVVAVKSPDTTYEPPSSSVPHTPTHDMLRPGWGTSTGCSIIYIPVRNLGWVLYSTELRSHSVAVCVLDQLLIIMWHAGHAWDRWAFPSLGRCALACPLVLCSGLLQCLLSWWSSFSVEFIRKLSGGLPFIRIPNCLSTPLMTARHRHPLNQCC